jgi:hypothetical protein
VCRDPVTVIELVELAILLAVIHAGALNRLLDWAKQSPEVVFGCRLLTITNILMTGVIALLLLNSYFYSPLLWGVMKYTSFRPENWSPETS